MINDVQLFLLVVSHVPVLDVVPGTVNTHYIVLGTRYLVLPPVDYAVEFALVVIFCIPLLLGTRYRYWYQVPVLMIIMVPGTRYQVPRKSGTRGTRYSSIL